MGREVCFGDFDSDALAAAGFQGMYNSTALIRMPTEGFGRNISNQIYKPDFDESLLQRARQHRIGHAPQRLKLKIKSFDASALASISRWSYSLYFVPPPSPPHLSPSEKRKARREARIEKRRAKREREAKKLAKARQEARKAERREAKKARKARQAEDARRRRALRQAKRILVKRGWVPRDAEVNTTMLRSELQKARTENKPAKVSTLTRMLASVEPANE